MEIRWSRDGCSRRPLIHRRLREILDGMFPFVGLLSLDGIVLEANRTPLEAAGLSREDIIGKPCAETYWFSHSEAVQADLRAALARAGQGEAVRYDTQIRVAEGALMTIDLMFGPLRDAHGTVVQVIGSAVDITERRQTEAALRESDARLRLAIEAANVGLWDWDLETDQIYLSPEWKHQLGCQDLDIENTLDEWKSRLHPDDLEPTLEAVRSGCSATARPRSWAATSTC